MTGARLSPACRAEQCRHCNGIANPAAPKSQLRGCMCDCHVAKF